MTLAVAAEHVALAEAVRGWAERAGVRRVARAVADGDESGLDPLWQALTAQDLLAPASPQQPDVVAVAVVAEELGRALGPAPYATTAAALLSGVECATAGLGVGAIALFSDADVLVTRDGAAYPAVQVSTRRVAALDPTRPAGEVTFTGQPASVAATFRATVATLLAAEATGVADWCLDTAVEYAKVREQFGRPIGAFQAVKHRCADMLAQVELARAAVWDAARALDQGEPAELAADVAVAVAADAAVECAKSCIQVLGGIGYTWEHDAHLYLKRALAIRQMLGGTSAARRSAVRRALAGERRPTTVDLPLEAEQYRADVRALLGSLPADEGERRRAIADSGYLVPHWPKPWGRDASPVEQLVVDEEFAAAQVKRPDLVIGAWALPAILQYGTEAQRERFVRPTLHGEITWCQMFSEPGAGSDLASLTTKASRVDGGWSLSGQKVWTSVAQRADWAICLARTNPDVAKHKGITYFLLDMRSDGIDIRPLRELTGEALFNEVFLNDVFVADDCVVGEVDGGWRLARTTLANERVAMSSGAAFGGDIEELLALVDGSDESVVDRVGRLLCTGRAETLLGLRQTLHQVSGTDPGAASSVRKLVGMLRRQDAAELLLELHGPAGLLDEGAAAQAIHQVLSTRALTIAGGTSEVLRNVIGERILGLPRDAA
jgi:alkylation response protein AidB-like acyl-CoA dehydrogenase